MKAYLIRVSARRKTLLMLLLLFSFPYPLPFSLPFSCSPGFVPAALAGNATLLVQESTVTGSQNVYITPRALRIDNKKTGTTIVCKAPQWQVDIYNKRNRSVYSCAPQEFKASFFNTFTKVYRENFASLKWKKSSSENRDGIEISKLGVQLDGKRGRLDLMNVDVRSGEYFVATSFKLPSKACDVLATFYSLPLVGEIPIQCIFYGMHAETLTPLSTKEIKNISVVDPFFEVPKFAVAKSERDVFIDPTARQTIEEMFGESQPSR
jgi:hypothetical protein